MRLAFLTENLTLKLFSLAVAVLLFLFVSVESATPVDVDFRLEYRTADDIMIVGKAPDKLHTTLQGPWATFRSFDINELKPVVIDLTTAGPGSMRYSLDTTDVDPPGGMNVVAITPSEIELTLDRKVERQFLVQVDLIGRPAFGYVLESNDVSPRRVRVNGPASLMQTIDHIYTRPLDIEGKTESFTTDLDLSPPRPPLFLRDRHVTVSVQIAEEFVTRAFDNLPVRAADAPAGTRVTPERVSIKLNGPRSLIESLDAKSLEPYIDVAPEFEAGQTAFDKQLSLRGQPDRTQLVGALPRVQVQLPKGKTKKPATATNKKTSGK